LLRILWNRWRLVDLKVNKYRCALGAESSKHECTDEPEGMQHSFEQPEPLVVGFLQEM
jgi:hypothetical protein